MIKNWKATQRKCRTSLAASIALMTVFVLTILIFPGQGASAGTGEAPAGRSLGQLGTNITTPGVAKHGADYWHDVWGKGSGVKIGIIDRGFIGYGTPSSEFPSGSKTRYRCVNPSGVITSTVTACRSTSGHGITVARIAYDMAEDAEFYIANSRTMEDAVSAINRNGPGPAST